MPHAARALRHLLRRLAAGPSRLLLVLITTAGLLAGTLALGGPAHAGAPSRAMWVWSKADPQAVVSFAQSHGVSALFVAVPPAVATSGDLPRLQQLAALAQGAGIRVDALGGDPTWTTNHTAALSWERAAMGTGLFQGVHVDVEPYALSGWSQPKTQAKLISSYLGLLSQMRQTAGSAGLPLEADVAFWYGTVATSGGTLADGVLARVDAVTVMSYRDTATGPGSIADVGADFLARGAAAGRPVRLAVETNPLPDCTYCTFYEEGPTALEQAMAAVDSAEAGSTAYAGLTVEDYDGWSALTGQPDSPASVQPHLTRLSTALQPR